MAQDFDQFPTYDPVTRSGEKMSEIWSDFMATFYMNLIGYLTSNGLLLPQLTSSQRDAIQSPQNGQMIYNTTIGSAQYFKAGAWSSF